MRPIAYAIGNTMHTWLIFLAVAIIIGLMNAHRCQCTCLECKNRETVWQIIASHYNGLRLCDVVEWTTLPSNVTADIVEELHVDGHVYYERRTGRWRAEMSLD